MTLIYDRLGKCYTRSEKRKLELIVEILYILPFYPTQHLSLMQFDVRYFYQQMIKISNSVQSLPYLIGYCWAGVSIYSDWPKLTQMIKKFNLKLLFFYTIYRVLYLKKLLHRIFQTYLTHKTTIVFIFRVVVGNIHFLC